MMMGTMMQGVEPRLGVFIQNLCWQKGVGLGTHRIGGLETPSELRVNWPRGMLGLRPHVARDSC